ncbi:hypothetical protein LQG66_36290 [Bradyrhizobium ontarionense]|uniref:Uncharacterized protein n=1 Tax=Bradyrhizobium ontarionense TaxID=2898149 RepID=A0ABY3RBY8_9BRAD|nr:hypothetical protein [Bradyrhizobium sp. A19]UFZ04583.1 hypothetical protein LQG66_36290 [Bradyrhizobium sp. A19]
MEAENPNGSIPVKYGRFAGAQLPVVVFVGGKIALPAQRKLRRIAAANGGQKIKRGASWPNE